MKTPGRVLLGGLCSLLAVAGTAQNAEESRNTGDFSKIMISGPYEVYLTQGETNTVRILAEKQEYIGAVKTDLEDGVLKIAHGERKSMKKAPEVHVTFIKLESIIASGAAEVESKGVFTAGNIYLESSGAANMKLNLNAEEIRSEASGASTLRLTGTAKSIDAKVHGASTLKATDLETQKASVNVSGAASARVYPKETLTADVSGAGSVIYKGDPRDRNVNVSGGGSVRQSRNGTGSETSQGDTTRIRWGDKKVLIIDEDAIEDAMEEVEENLEKLGKELEEKFDVNCKESCCEHDDHHRHYRRLKEELKHKHKHAQRKVGKKWKQNDFNHWAGIELGVNGYVNSRNQFTLPENYNYLDLDYSRSLTFSVNFIEHGFRLYRNHVRLVTGAGFEFSAYSFKHPVTLDPNSSMVRGSLDTTVHYQKNKLKSTFINVPLLLEFNTGRNPNKTFHLAGGVFGGYRLGSKTKQIYEAENYEYKVKKKDDYNLSPFRYGATVRAGVGKFTLFANYALSELFEKGKGPRLHPFSVGVRLVGF